MADWGGAVMAIKAQFLAQWVNGGALKTPVGFPNEAIRNVDGSVFAGVGSPAAEDGSPLPWVFFRVLANGGIERGVGQPGAKIWLDRGLISISVFGPKNYGVDALRTLAVAAGNIFRASTLYRDDASGAKIVCSAPTVDDGGEVSQTPIGDQFPVTCSIPFEFFYQA